MLNFLSPRFLPEVPDPHGLAADPPARVPGAVGVLLINLGTPDEPTAKSIRRYLAEFLSDPRVIEIPSWVWQIILRAAILPLRPGKLVPRYRQVWHQDGSPLLVWSQAQARGVKAALDAGGAAVHVELGMRYGNPSVASAMQALRDKGCDKILTVPMYPQYAASTTATAVDCVTAYAARLRDQPEMRFIKRYHDHPAYIDALIGRVRQYWQEHGKPQRLLLSFHGLPRRVIEQGDPYHRDCIETARQIKRALGDDAALVHTSFQSRFGAERWLEPYTEPTLKAWAAQGVTRVDVMCPGFLADCIETLEEIQVECRDAFLAAGGAELRYISCLNDDPAWTDGYAKIIREHLAGWM